MLFALVSLFGLAAAEVSILPVAPMGVPTISWCNETLTPAVVKSYSWTPKDIHVGDTVTFTFDTDLKETVTGGTLREIAKVFGITVLDETDDLCEMMAQGGYRCPLSQGRFYVKQTVEIPDVPMHGKVNSHTVIKDQNSGLLMCVDIQISI
eukprot:260589_1